MYVTCRYRTHGLEHPAGVLCAGLPDFWLMMQPSTLQSDAHSNELLRPESELVGMRAMLSDWHRLLPARCAGKKRAYDDAVPQLKGDIGRKKFSSFFHNHSERLSR